MDDNREYIEVLKRQSLHLDAIAMYQLAVDAKSWRFRTEGVR